MNSNNISESSIEDPKPSQYISTSTTIEVKLCCYKCSAENRINISNTHMKELIPMFDIYSKNTDNLNDQHKDKKE